jgi:hypothetical protein
MPPLAADVPSSSQCATVGMRSAGASRAVAATGLPARTSTQPTVATMARLRPSKSMIMWVNDAASCGSTTTRDPPPRYCTWYLTRSLPSRPIATTAVGRNSISPPAEHRIAQAGGEPSDQCIRQRGDVGTAGGRLRAAVAA